MNHIRRAAAAAGVMAIVSLLLVGAVSAARQDGSIAVTATDSGFKLSAASAPVGTVSFKVTNKGRAQHNFRVAGKSTKTLSKGQSATLSVAFAKAGSYAYSSTIKGDVAKGLKGTFKLFVPPTYPPITVLAAASLTDVFPAIDGSERYSFAGSNALATQIRNGAPADVFASANTDIPAQLYQQGLVDKPVNFTRNALVIVVPKANPAGIETIYDLTKGGIKLDIAASSVPVGSYTLQVLEQIGLSAKVLANVVSQETDVRTVLSKVALGQADAGFVYATDAKTAPDDVKVIKVPAWAQPKVIYAMAVVSRSPNKDAARAFIARILSASGQATMAKYGFLPLPGTAASTGYLARHG